MIRVVAFVLAGGACAIAAIAYGCSSSSPAPEHIATYEAGTLIGDDDEATESGVDTGAGDDAGTGDESDANNGNDAGPVPLTCAALCSEAFSACSASQLGFGSQLICASECAALPTGALGDTGDSLGCRLAQAKIAQIDAGACVAAGASGGGACGARCDAYCTLVFAICVTANRNAVNPYASMGACTTACAGFALEDGGPEYDPAPSNTLECRQYHLQQAWSDPVGGSAFDECPNLAATGGACN